MLICICNGIREKDFRAVVREGAADPGDAYARLGRRPKCGQCVSFAKTVMDNERVPA